LEDERELISVLGEENAEVLVRVIRESVADSDLPWLKTTCSQCLGESPPTSLGLAPEALGQNSRVLVVAHHAFVCDAVGYPGYAGTRSPFISVITE
jgi:hypothetical protein